MRTQSSSFVITSDGKEFPSDTNYLIEQAIKHQMIIKPDLPKKEARKLLSHCVEITVQNGDCVKKFRGPAVSTYDQAGRYEERLELLNLGKQLADILYPGEMTKEEYIVHMADNYQNLKGIMGAVDYY